MPVNLFLFQKVCVMIISNFSDNQNVTMLYLLIVFGITLKFLLSFFFKLALVFLGSAAISKTLHIDRVYEEGRNTLEETEYSKKNLDD